ncbi:MAG: imidazolonepropionase [Candidatus Sericytochromatia bacterium]
MEIDLLIENASELLPINSKNRPLMGKDFKDLEIIENAYLAVKDKKIVGVGKKDILKDFFITANTKIINAEGKTVLPGFVDCHTHLVFAGSREHEFVGRIEKSRNPHGATMGSGIKFTVSKTREAEKQELINIAQKRLKRMLNNGITTIEAKSGYGLDFENEMKILEVINDLKKIQKVEIETTFLGAHSVPEGHTPESYTDIVINEMLPHVVKNKSARFCDVFCEKGFFSYEQTEKILSKAKDAGMLLKLHADQLNDSDAAELAAKLGVISADHLDHAKDEGIKSMAKKAVVGVLLPSISFTLDIAYPNAQKMMEFGLPIALSTDFNPGAGYSEAISLVLSLACIKMKLLPIEAIACATLNAAYACGRGHDLGSLEIGKQADIIILDAPNHRYIPYHYGINLVEKVIKKGEVVV